MCLSLGPRVCGNQSIGPFLSQLQVSFDDLLLNVSYHGSWSFNHGHVIDPRVNACLVNWCWLCPGSFCLNSDSVHIVSQ